MDSGIITARIRRSRPQCGCRRNGQPSHLHRQQLREHATRMYTEIILSSSTPLYASRIGWPYVGWPYNRWYPPESPGTDQTHPRSTTPARRFAACWYVRLPRRLDATDADAPPLRREAGRPPPASKSISDAYVLQRGNRTSVRISTNRRGGPRHESDRHVCEPDGTARSYAYL